MSSNASYSSIGGGSENGILDGADLSTIGGGNANVINYQSVRSTIGGGGLNGIAASTATISGGEENVIWATAATIPGGMHARAMNYGQFAYASGGGSYTGAAQTSMYVLRNGSTSTNSTELFLDGSSARMSFENSAAWTFDVLIVGYSASTGNTGHYQVVGGIKSIGGTTSLVGTPVKIVLGENVGTWDVTVAADDANDALVITVNGDNTSINWVATVKTVEVK